MDTKTVTLEGITVTLSSNDNVVSIELNGLVCKIDKKEPTKVKVIKPTTPTFKRNSKGTRLLITLKRRKTTVVIRGGSVGRIMSVVLRMTTKTFKDFSYLTVAKLDKTDNVLSETEFYIKDFREEYEEVNKQAMTEFEEHLNSEGIRSLLKYNT